MKGVHISVYNNKSKDAQNSHYIIFILLCFKTELIVLADLELDLLPWPPKYWDCRHISPFLCCLLYFNYLCFFGYLHWLYLYAESTVFIMVCLYIFLLILWSGSKPLCLINLGKGICMFFILLIPPPFSVPRALHMLSRCFSTELYPFFYNFHFLFDVFWGVRDLTGALWMHVCMYVTD